jgi:hypothetical protein
VYRNIFIYTVDLNDGIYFDWSDYSSNMSIISEYEMVNTTSYNEDYCLGIF